jgi:flavin-dependent dehydrogenase
MDDGGPRTFDCDVLVVGGGPGGSTISTLLARRGWRVTMLEKARHPRFHIGESLLPANMAIFEEIGALEKLRGLGRLKLGADFPRDDGSYYTFRFDRALGETPPYAFQVKREEMDRMLFEHAREHGVDEREQVKVERVEFDAGNRPALVHARDADGNALAFRPRYLVDASGRDAFLGGKLKLKRKNPRHQSAAVFSHYRGVERRPGRDAGNVSIYRHEHGWAWLIPLADGDMSVGAVCYPEYLKTRKGDSEGFLLRTLDTIPEVARRMEGAQRVAPVHVTGNYAYECTRMSGPGWLLVGDAWNFVDPMFSSGVMLATNSGFAATEVVDARLKGDRAAERSARARFDWAMRRGPKEFSWFIYRVTNPNLRDIFMDPREDLDIRASVISVLAGDLFRGTPIRRGLLLFRAIYYLTSLADLRRSLAAWRRHACNIRDDSDANPARG